MIKKARPRNDDEIEIDLAEELQRTWNYYIAKGKRTHSIYLDEDSREWLADIVKEQDGSTVVRAASGEVRTCTDYKAALAFCRVLTIEAEWYGGLQ